MSIMNGTGLTESQVLSMVSGLGPSRKCMHAEVVILMGIIPDERQKYIYQNLPRTFCVHFQGPIEKKKRNKQSQNVLLTACILPSVSI